MIPTLAAIVGIVGVVWLIADLRRLAQFKSWRDDVRIDEEWKATQEREDRLKAAAIWKGYKRP